MAKAYNETQICILSFLTNFNKHLDPLSHFASLFNFFMISTSFPNRLVLNDISERTMLVNSVENTTMGFLFKKEGPEAGIIVKEYEPAIIWNLKVFWEATYFTAI